jgi:hypothetical protein
MRSLRRVGAVAAVLVSTLPLSGLAGAPGPAGAASAPSATVRSVLILSLPAISWADLRDAPAPHLRALLADSAVADLSTRTVRLNTDASNGYLALGAGARAVGSASLAGQNLEPDEPYGDSTAGEVFTRRTGRSDRVAVGVLGIPGMVDDNDAQPFGTIPGSLGTALHRAGVARRVVANADEAELQPPDQQLHREAVLGLMDETGRVTGTVGPNLLEEDPAAPYGLRLDADRVVAAFPRSFTARPTVALVEASDLARADAYRPLAGATQRAAMRRAALVTTDRMVGRLLQLVDLRRDAVVVVGPYHSGRQRELTIMGVHAPGVEPGYLQSSTTRRPGFVQIVDVAPTVLDLLGIERPDAMEGRPVEASSGSTSFESRMRFLVRANREAVFRDATIGTATAVVVVATIALTIGAFLALRYRRRDAHAVLGWAGFALLGFLIGTFVAGALPFDRWGTTAYFAFLVAWSLGFAAICRLVGRRNPADGLVVALGAIVALHSVDLLTGAHLELNTVFGYTPTVGIRLAGVGNPGSAQLCASALLVATLIAWRLRAPIGLWVASLVLGIVVIVVGAPFFGQDFGGAISATPAYLLFLLLVTGRRVSLKAIGLLGGVLVAVGLVVGFVDLTRPADRRTHVGRFFEKIGNDGPSAFTEVIGRKLGLMLRTFSNTGWVLVVAIALAAFVYVARRTDLLTRLLAWITTMRAGLVAFATLIVLATVLNDSGVQVTGMMTAVFVPTFVILGCRATELPASASAASGPSPAALDDAGAGPATPPDERAPARSPA